jgi:hypothetical protein
MSKRWINTKVEFEWDGTQYVETTSEGYWYEGEMALMEPITATTAFAIYTVGKLAINTVQGWQQKGVNRDLASGIEKGLVQLGGSLPDAREAAYGKMEIASEKMAHSTDKLLTSVSTKLSDAYATIRDTGGSLAKNFQSIQAADRAKKSLWESYSQGMKDIDLAGQDMNIEAFEELFTGVASTQRRKSDMEAKIKRLRG